MQSGGLLAVLLGLLLFVAPGCHRAEKRAQVQTQAAATSPYRNTRPGVPYVGDDACAACHPDQAETYRHHPMGRSLAPVAQSTPVERYEPAAHNPFERLGLFFAVERGPQGRTVHKVQRRDAHGRAVAEETLPVQFAIGSGTRGRSYLADRDGYLFESPASWFAQKNAWDLSPGFEHFYPPDRVVEPVCLFCHANHAEVVEGTRNRYREPIFRGYAIGCERCHGPGELHVRLREAGEPAADPDDTIVNPRRLPPVLREAVCQQCHLQGKQRFVRAGRGTFDYRPGLPLHNFWAIFVGAPDFSDSRRAIGQVEQLASSRCFTASGGKMGCISCHDPHSLPAPKQRVAYYRRRCLSCHEEQGCALPLAARRAREPADSCIACHMPRLQTADIAHTALTDHRILRRPDTTDPQSAPRPPRPGEVPIVSFYAKELDAQDPANTRDLGIALAGLTHKPGPLRGPLIPLARPLLEKAVEASPNDAAAWEALGWVRSLEGRTGEALAAYDAALERAPGRELTLFLAASLARQRERPEAALRYFERLLPINPWIWDYHFPLAQLLAERRDWPHALAESEAALRLNPSSDETRVLVISCLLHCGKHEPARKELEKLLALHPDEERVWRSWFEQQQP